MKQLTSILTITGSDSLGGAGIQNDIRTITALGCYAVTAITSINVTDEQGLPLLHDIDTDLVMQQVKCVLDEVHPKAIKIGLVRNVQTIVSLSKEIIRCKNIILAPGILSSKGEMLLSNESIEAWKRYLIPQASILLLKCSDAEVLLDMKIQTDEDMFEATAKLQDMGAKYVLLRGGKMIEGMLKALLHKPNNDSPTIFTSQNTDGWQRHGVGGALSSAIATRLALGDNMDEAISNAHSYVHSQFVYAVTSDDERRLRSADIYNMFMGLIAVHYRSAHDVAFYASKLNVSTRYLSKVTMRVIGKSPKQLISEYLVNEIITMLGSTRLNMQEISDTMGFSSQAVFCKFFVSQKGCSPTEYRILL